MDAGSIRDGTKIPAEANMGTVTCISWKSDLIVRGDSEGNINIYNVKTRECKTGIRMVCMKTLRTKNQTKSSSVDNVHMHQLN